MEILTWFSHPCATAPLDRDRAKPKAIIDVSAMRRE
jgi:hypothetical protein